MAAITLKAFTGLNPKTDPELLQPTEAQVASNVKLNTGALTPSRGNTALLNLPKSNPKTIYRFGQSVADETMYWFSFFNDVDITKGAINEDTTERTFYTGDGVPKVTNAQLALTGGNNYPIASLALGVPRPSGTIAVSAIAPPQVVTPEGEDPPPEPPSEFRSYVVVLVNSFGEQGAPNVASTPIEIKEGGGATLNNIPGAPSGLFNITTKRIFRSASASSGAVFRFVAEVPVGTSSFVDRIPTDALGESLVTDDFDPPPAGLLGLTLMANGILAGFVGSDVYFTPPFLPYAWPEKYIQTVESAIVGIAPLGQSLAVLTKGHPHVIFGADPENFSAVKLPDKQACVSKRSIVPMLGGAMFASPDGLMLVTESGVKPMTENLFTRDQWQLYKPTSIHAYEYNNQYVAFYDTGAKRGKLIFDFTGKQATFTDSADWASAGFSDKFTDQLYTINNQVLSKQEAGPLQTGTWRSKKFRMPKPLCFAFGQVEADVYPVQFTVYADNILRYTLSVTNPENFRLPGGFLSRVWEIELGFTGTLHQAAIAQSVEELQKT
jgi:hypothetical protein